MAYVPISQPPKRSGYTPIGTPVKPKPKTVPPAEFLQRALPTTSLVQPMSSGIRPFSTREESLKKIDADSRTPSTVVGQPRAGSEIYAGKPLLENRVPSALRGVAQQTREALFGTGVEGAGLQGKAKELGIIGSARRILGLKTTTQAIEDRANKLIETGIDEDRAWRIAQEDVPVQGKIPGSRVQQTKTVALTKDEEKSLRNVRLLENVDTVMNFADVMSMGRTKIAREAVEQVVKRLAKTTEKRLIGGTLVRDLKIPVKDAIRLTEKIVPASTEDDVLRVLNDYVEDVANNAPTPRTATRGVAETVQDGQLPSRTTATQPPARVVDELESIRPREATDADVVVSVVTPTSGKVYTRISQRELQNLVDEVQNIPKNPEGYSQIHLDAVTDAQKTTGREVTRDEFITAHPQARGVLEQAVGGMEIAPTLYRLDGELVSPSGVKKGVVEYITKEGFQNKRMPVEEFYARAERMPVGVVDETTPGVSGSPVDRAKNTYARDAVSRQPKVEARSKEGLTRLTGELLTPISSRLERINPELKKALRRFESNVAQGTRKDTQQILPFLKSFSKMSNEDWAVLDLAMKNGDVATIDALAKQYDMADELALVRQTLDDLHIRAKEAGMEVNYRENYFPRIVNDPKALIRYLLGSGEFTATDELIDMLARSKGKKYLDLTDEEIAAMLNTQVRGYGEPIGLTSPKFTKQRTIREINADLNRFYVDSDESLATYVVRMNDEIEARKFFGKGENIDESIGAYLIKEVNAGRLNPMDIPEVSSILKSRFSRGKMNGALEVYRNAEYISTMGSPTSAITQLGDLAFGAYKNGVYHHLKGMAKTISRTGVTKEQLGIERITEEFSSRTKSAQALDFVFKATGLTVLDRLGKESLINGSFSKLRTMAKNGDPKLYDELFRSLNADEIPQAIDDLKAGKLTNLTEVALFNRLLDFQPVAKSEMPEMYLRHPNGRIFYMLKSFTLKQIDIFRRESLDLITSGDPKKVAQGMGNLVRLSGMFMLANMGADAIKDAVTGRETDVSDTVIDNMWRLVGASKYDVYKAKTDGAGKTVIGKILFPTSLWDRAYQDASNLATGKEYKTGPLKGEAYKSELIQSVPFAGKLYYWWFGRGAQKEMYNNVSTNKEGNLELPKMPELPKLPALPKL